RWLRMKAVVRQADANCSLPSSWATRSSPRPPSSAGIPHPSAPTSRTSRQDASGQAGSRSARSAASASAASLLASIQEAASSPLAPPAVGRHGKGHAGSIPKEGAAHLILPRKFVPPVRSIYKVDSLRAARENDSADLPARHQAAPQKRNAP